MLKFVNTMVVFQEIPDEISLDINISNCPFRCPGCHSSYLQTDIGEELTEDKLKKMIEENDGISCVLFSGGDSDRRGLLELIKFVKDNFSNLKTAVYSGDVKADMHIWNSGYLDYYKIGPWIDSLGPLDCETTNQRLYKLTNEGYVDITYKFLEKRKKTL